MSIANNYAEFFEEYHDYRVVSLPMWGQALKALQVDQVRAVSQVSTIEDHLMDGGFGSWLLESVANENGLTDRINVRALRSEVCGMVGAQNVLNDAALF